MDRKSTDAYRSVFQFIERNIVSLKCRQFMTDFEKAMRNALAECYPDADQLTCWFHLCQAVRRRATQIPKFIDFINGNAVAMLIYRQIMCLPLLRHDLIYPAFNNLKLKALAINAVIFKPFLDYFENQWLINEGPEVISVFRKATRTNSGLEGNNSQLSRRFDKHGSFFKFVSCLRDEDFMKTVEMEQLCKGVEPRPKKKKIRVCIYLYKFSYFRFLLIFCCLLVFFHFFN